MPKPTHREVKFTREEMEYDLPDEVDFNKMRLVGRGRHGLEMARRISRARGAAKKKLIESLPRMEEVVEVRLDSDVAEVFKDAKKVNNILRAVIQNMPDAEKKKFKKTA
jgi:uncharacterized protein (DUF4415 family)